MFNKARGSHSSPGVYMREVDVTYSAKSLGLTSLGLAGETLEGPAFEPVEISKWSEFVDYFGTTSTEKFKGTKYPKYELPYVAKEYLKESNSLKVVRVLGLSGYDAGKAWTITLNKSKGTESEDYALVVLRSKGTYNGSSAQGCETASGDTIDFDVTSVTISAYTSYVYNGDCEKVGVTGTPQSFSVDANNLGRFNITFGLRDGSSETYPVSLNYGEKNYIYNVFGSDPLKGDAPVFVEEFYDNSLKDLINNTPTGYSLTINTTVSPQEKLNNYKETYRPAQTPWFVSAISNEGGKDKIMKKLFKAYTITDGNAANKKIKISIQNIRPDDGTFDLVVRDFNDTDSAPSYLEKFSKCDLVPGSSNYLPLKVGTIDGLYELKSKYIILEMSTNDIEGCVPCGFLGFPLHKFENNIQNMDVSYNTTYDESIKAKRQYFGMSDRSGVDEDTLSYKGNGTTELSNGFHLDTIINKKYGTEIGKILVDGKEGYEFTTVNPVGLINNANGKSPRIMTETYMKGTFYEDVNTRKFTVYPYGGFDGWDIYRTERTNTDSFSALKYNGETYTGYTAPYLNLPSNAINSDYYAYLGGYRQFANAEAVDINIFATPGIDYINNPMLVDDALDMIEDTDDGRRGDAIYIVTSPNMPTNAVDETEDSMYTAEEIVSAVSQSSIDSSYIATYWPWVKIFDSVDNKYINLPPTKDVVRNMAYTDNTSYPWFSPAGISRGTVDCVRASKKLKAADEDVLYDGMVNPIKTFAVDGVKVWGNKTLYSVESPLNRVNVRRLMLRVKKLVNNAAKNLIFEPYDTALENQFRSLVNPILSSIKQNRGIYDYRISVESSEEARDEHTLPATISIKPTPTLEWIDLTFTIYPESVDFAD